MTGYITVYKPDMKIRDFERYSEYYCGLCRSLRDRYGQLSRFSLGYDMTFLAALIDGVYDSETRRVEFRCAGHPAAKKYKLENSFIDYAADMNIYMTYLKCLDDWHDDRSLSRWLYARILRRKARRVEENYRAKTEAIKKHMAELAVFENENSTDFEGAAGCFGRVAEEVFSYGGIWDNRLSRVGFYLGKYIYLLDAYEDIEDDLKKGSYNPFRELSRDEDFDGKVKEILMSMISECTEEFEMLPVDENMDILRNILYAGVWQRFNETAAERQKIGSMDDGDHEEEKLKN